jgi:hypothetical protein
MGQAAALVGSAAIGAAGSSISAKASQPKAIEVPPPRALFPGVQDSYMNALMDSGLGKTSFGTLEETARTGLPTDVGPAFEALKTSMGRGINEGRANLIEQYGSQGLRFSQPMANAAVDFESETQKGFASILADYTRQATEAAANRRFSAATLGQGAFGEVGTAMTPTAVVASGGQSALGEGLKSGASSIQNIVLMKSLFPEIFK